MSTRLWRALTAYYSKAPGTLVYLFTLTVTTWTLAGTDRATDHKVMVSASTNLHNMTRDPIRVLVASAFWNDSAGFPWVVFAEFLLLMAAAERWLGTGRWLMMFVAGHVGATLVTVTGIAWALDRHLLPHRLAGTVDVGTSYGFFAVAAVFTYRFRRRRWRLIWAVGLAGYLIFTAWRRETFTDYGHLTAMLIGFAAYPLTRRLTATSEDQLGERPSNATILSS
jgi:hypothetical protein